MKQPSTQFRCSECGRLEPKWLGRCSECGSWNSFVEEVVEKKDKLKKTPLVSDPNKQQVVSLMDVELSDTVRFSSGSTELDRVLGGGLMQGGAVLLGGEPGIGKSTLLLQMLGSLQHLQVLYVSGEESPSQIRLRASRVLQEFSHVKVFGETQVEPLLEIMDTVKPHVMVIDSLQTLTSTEYPSPAGSISQMRVCSLALVEKAKRDNITLFLIGHITKEGQIAGPKAIEHLVDTVLYFEQAGSDVRIIRAVKNRFGSVDEIGIFLMSEKGLIAVSNPAGFFLSEREGKDLPPGVAFTAVVEGSRNFLVEIQALTVPAKSMGNNRVYSERIDTSRVTRIAAVLERHGGISLSNSDIYVNVAGGIKLSEVSIELPLALALYSAVRGKALPASLVSVGEVSLAGEIRPVGFGERRAKGTQEMGFSHMLLPHNMPVGTDMTVFRCDRIIDALEILEKM